MLKVTAILILSVSSFIVFSQNNKYDDIKKADDYFNQNNFINALPIYQSVLKTDKYNTYINYKIGECYLNTHINKSDAIQYFEICSKDSKIETDIWLKLGKAYRYNYNFEKAIKAFEKYLELEPKKKKIAEREIEICNNAKELIKYPVNFTFTDLLGKDINSEFADYYPWISENETFLAFTTRRKGYTAKKTEIDGYYASDIYVSRVENGKWLKAENIGTKINTSLDEQVVGLKADGSELLIYIDHIDKYGDIYYSKKNNGFFNKYIPFPKHINKNIERSACISPDGNTLFVVKSQHETDQTDIYICRKLPNGKWSEPLKLGNEINTPYNEDFPYLASDGVTLYFSSEGHNTMGGFDLFKSEWNTEQNTWSNAINLGYPINTTDDDRSISLTQDKRVGYISALRPKGQGSLDIYRVKFNDIEQKLTLYIGEIILTDSLNSSEQYNVKITATNLDNNEEYSFIPNPKNGTFVMALPAGNYDILVSAEGYLEIKDKLFVSDLGLPVTEEKITYLLFKQNE